ncbi:DUF6505 family protein [Tepidamorphus sp. 3E244]|uniref:DUF6505 family protein n=1 Tax=Tepidamorphus sp. 3E244 TaxID=3385498 RepID=UPI0038FCD1A5
MKLLRTIRFDQSDDHVFETAAASDEWAVSGAFEFAELPPDEIKGKTKQAFANGFMSLESFGRSTFVSVATIETDQLARLTDELADHFCRHYGAPDIEAARPVATEEIAFATSLVAEVPINTVFTVRRTLDDDNAIREEFRTVTPPAAPVHSKIWDVVDDNDT